MVWGIGKLDMLNADMWGQIGIRHIQNQFQLRFVFPNSRTLSGSTSGHQRQRTRYGATKAIGGISVCGVKLTVYPQYLLLLKPWRPTSRSVRAD